MIILYLFSSYQPWELPVMLLFWPVPRGGVHSSEHVRQHRGAARELPVALALNPEVRASAPTGPPASGQTPSSGRRFRPCWPNSPASRWDSSPCRAWTGLSPVRHITLGSEISGEDWHSFRLTNTPQTRASLPGSGDSSASWAGPVCTRGSAASGL